MIEQYALTITGLGLMAMLMLIQLLIADLVGLRTGHLPGSTIETDHGSLLFRASRTVANTNESIAIYVLAVAFAVFSEADPLYTAYCTLAYVALRAAYAFCYYANLQILRSVCFGLSLTCLLALLLVGGFA